MRLVRLRLEIMSLSSHLLTQFVRFALLGMISNVGFALSYLFLHMVDSFIHISIVPPYGQEEIENLQSIFEKPHLQRNFLDTQCKYTFYAHDFGQLNRPFIHQIGCLLRLEASSLKKFMIINLTQILSIRLNHPQLLVNLSMSKMGLNNMTTPVGR